jgi:polyhydroxyalkanoate synthesis regulator phasin
MKNTKHNPTMMIKSSFSNKIHNLLGIKHKKYSKEWYEDMKQRRELTHEEKSKLFDEIMRMYNETSEELINYRKDRRLKKCVNKKRVERGYVPKKKIKKEYYEKNLQNDLVIS